MIFDTQDGFSFPLMTKSKVNFKAVLSELLWFIRGSTNINDLDSNIWNEWANEDGSVGPMYGHHFRMDFNKYNDPLQDTIGNIELDPLSRRHVMTTWRHELLPYSGVSPTDNVKIGKQALANCHGTAIQFYVDGDTLHLSHYQRSGDAFLGVKFNIPSYATLLLIVSRITGYKAGKVYFDLGDAHIYNNHFGAVEEYISRDILHPSPSLEFEEGVSLDEITFEHFTLSNYQYQPHIKAEISI